MIDYFVTDAIGCVVRVGRVPETQLEWQRCGGFQVGLAKIGDYLDSAGQVQALPEAPSAEHVFDYSTHGYVLDVVRVRAKRDTLLLACDWTQLTDVPMATKAAWAVYRQALRDITLQPEFPVAVEWPVAPA